MICHCRGIDDRALREAFETFRQITYGGTPDTREDLAPLIDDYDCGGCSRIFDRAAENFAETGELGLFKRSRRNVEVGYDLKSEASSGLCAHAQSQIYSADKDDGVPNLQGTPIHGAPRLA